MNRLLLSLLCGAVIAAPAAAEIAASPLPENAAQAHAALKRVMGRLAELDAALAALDARDFKSSAPAMLALNWADEFASALPADAGVLQLNGIVQLRENYWRRCLAILRHADSPVAPVAEIIAQEATYDRELISELSRGDTPDMRQRIRVKRNLLRILLANKPHVDEQS